VSACTDHRCSEGVTWCVGCNGFGVLAAGGRRKYRLRSGARNISPNAPTHEPCFGTGLAVCGCVPLDADTVSMLSGQRADQVA
jgi:hypothetical protein